MSIIKNKFWHFIFLDKTLKIQFKLDDKILLSESIKLTCPNYEKFFDVNEVVNSIDKMLLPKSLLKKDKNYPEILLDLTNNSWRQIESKQKNKIVSKLEAQLKKIKHKTNQILEAHRAIASHRFRINKLEIELRNTKSKLNTIIN